MILNFLMLIVRIHEYENDLIKRSEGIEEKCYNLTLARLTLVW